MKILLYAYSIIALILISSCSLFEDDITNSVNGTLTAIVGLNTVTPSKPVETPTPLPSETATLVPSQTATILPTPDYRIIDANPSTLLCTKFDLPRDGKYRIPGQGWMSINTNDEVLQARGTTKGREYVINTGRITGWWAVFLRGTKAVQLPEQMECGVFMFDTIEGAQLALEKYNSVETTELKPDESIEYVENIFDIGDKDISYIFHRQNSGGTKEIIYSIQFTYKNLMIDVDGYSAVESDLKPEVLEEIARTMLGRIMEVPLVDPDLALWPSR